MYTAEGIGLFGILGFLFFEESLFAGVLCLGAAPYVKLRKRERLQKRKEQLAKEFIRGAEAFLNAIEVGYSKENAVGEAVRDLHEFKEKESLILPEFIYIQRQLAVNRSVEELFLELGERSGIEDIESFAEIFAAAGKKGGNVVSIMKQTIAIMKEKQEVLKEIQVQTSAKRLEFRIMCLIVPGMVAYLNLFSPEFLKILYHNLLGQGFMILILAAYFGAVCLGERMTEVEI